MSRHQPSALVFSGNGSSSNYISNSDRISKGLAAMVNLRRASKIVVNRSSSTGFVAVSPPSSTDPDDVGLAVFADRGSKDVATFGISY